MREREKYQTQGGYRFSIIPSLRYTFTLGLVTHYQFCYFSMPHRHYPCGSLLKPKATFRSLSSPTLRLFVSIRTAKSVSVATKICNSCRHSFYTWKHANPDFGDILSTIESRYQDNADTDMHTDTPKVRATLNICYDTDLNLSIVNRL